MLCGINPGGHGRCYVLGKEENKATIIDAARFLFYQL
jgi:hypothetical protein